MKQDIENKEQDKLLRKEQKVPRKEQDNLPRKEQKIDNKEQDSLLRKDQKVPRKEQRTDNKEHQSVIKNFIGKDIAITLRNGNKIEGKLETITQYELVVSVSYIPTVVMKHAIDYITLIGEK